MDILKYFKKVLYTKTQIEKKCEELADWINKEYKNADDLIIVGLLKGSIPFLAQLIKSVKILHRLDFMTVSSYYGKISSSKNLKFIMDLNVDIYNQQVLIIDDIIDTGLTLSKVFAHLQNRKPKSIKTVVLFDKRVARKNDFQVDKYGFITPNEFLIGFGLDFKEKFRNIPFVGVFDQTKINLL